MLNSPLLMAATATTTAVASAATSSSPSLPPYTNLPLDHFALKIALFFPFKSKPFKNPKLSTHFSNLHFFTRPATGKGPQTVTLCASADNVDALVEETEEEEEGGIDEIEEEEEDDDDKDESVQSQSAEGGRLYVGNLPYSMSSSQLSEIFSEAGGVSKIEMVYDRVTGRSRGFAFVTMGSVEEAKEAIRMFDGSQVGGRTVKVNFPEVPKGGEREVIASRVRSSNLENINSPHRIYASNLSWNLTSQGLREAFADKPGFLNAKVVYDRESGKPRGFGFISFASAEDLESALNAMNGVEVEGRQLRLNIAKERSPTLDPSMNPGKEVIQSSEILSSFSS